MPCCTRDEGGPLAVGLQEQAANHLELRLLRAGVVSVEEKAGVTRQVWIEETSASEPLMRCRKRRDDVETGEKSLPRDKPGRHLLTVQAASGMKAA